MDVGELYRRHGGVVYRRVRSFYPADQAEEVSHEVWERVVKSVGSWKQESSAVTWLYQVATRHCLNRRRDEARRKELSATYGDPSWATACTAANQEAWTCLHQLWTKLDPDLFQIGLYHFRDGLSHAQIAEMMGTSRRTIGNRLAELQAQLAHTDETPQESPR